MNRRSFLMAVGVASASAIAPPFRLIYPNEPLRPGESVLFEYMRELGQYAPNWDAIDIRWDALFGNLREGGVQIGYGIFLNNDNPKELLNQVIIHRPIAADAIQMEMKKRGASFEDLKPLRIPTGHVNPWDMAA